MAVPFSIVNGSRPIFSRVCGIVAEVIPDYKSRTAIVCIQDVDDDHYEDYRALWREAANVKNGDFVVYNLMDDYDGDINSDDTNQCITSLRKTNDFLILTELQKLSL